MHYDTEDQRHPLFHQLVAEGALSAGYATDSGAGLLSSATNAVGAVAEVAGAAAHHVRRPGRGDQDRTPPAPARPRAPFERSGNINRDPRCGRWVESKLVLDDVFRLLGADLGVDTQPLADAYVDVEASAPALDDLMALGDRVWEMFHSVTPRLPLGKRHILIVSWAWLACTFRQSRSAFELVRLAYPDTTAVHSRSALEHAIYLSLISQFPDAEQIIESLGHKQLRHYNAVLAGQAAEPPVAVLAQLLSAITGTPVDPSSKWSTVFEQVCHHFVGGSDWYDFYRAFSDVSYVGFGSAMATTFAGIAGGSIEEPALTHNAFVLKVDLASRLLVCLSSCFWAGQAVDRLFPEPVFGTRLQVLDAIGVTPLVLKTV